MSKPAIIAIGHYDDISRDRMTDRFEVTWVDAPADLGDLPDATRAAALSLAFHSHDPMGGDLMDLVPNVGLIANFGVGYDAIDVDAAEARNIVVTNTPDVLNDDVADLGVGLYLALRRGVIEGDRWVRSGDWAREGTMPLKTKASGRRVGILGMGRVGRELADRLAAFKCEVHYQSRRPKDTPPDWVFHADATSLAVACDALFVTVVGGPETEGMVSAEVIEALGAEGVLINMARGSVIDEEALIDALQAGTIAGAALDVFLREPDPDQRFLGLDNVILQPHQGSATQETRAAMALLQFRNLACYADGAPLPTCVTKVCTPA